MSGRTPLLRQGPRVSSLTAAKALVLALLTTVASAQSIPPALWSGFELVGAESLQPFRISEIHAGVRIKEARARFQLGDFPRVRKELSDDAQWLRHEELIRSSQADEREAALIRALAAFFQEKDFDAFFWANEVHRSQGDADTPDALYREASLVKSLVLTRAGVLAPAYLFTVADEPNEGKLLLAEVLAEELRSHGEFITEPSVPEKPHPRNGSARVVVFEVQDPNNAEGQLRHVVFSSETGMFIGALVVETYRDGHDAPKQYRTAYHDLDAPPLVLREHGKRLPGLGDLVQLANSLKPDVPIGRRDANTKHTPLRAEVESLYWAREGVAPLAAWWAEPAGDNDQVRESVVEPLNRSKRLHWSKQNRIDVGRVADGGMVIAALGFKNSDVPEGAAFTASREPWEHYHFIVATRNGARYRASYALTSKFVELPDDPAGGVRLYYLYQSTPRGLRELDVPLSGEPPAYDDVAAFVRRQLENFERKAAAGGAAEPPIVRQELPAKAPLSWEESGLMIAALVCGALAVLAVMSIVLALVRKARSLGAFGVLLIGAVLGLAVGAAIFWSTTRNQPMPNFQNPRNSR